MSTYSIWTPVGLVSVASHLPVYTHVKSRRIRVPTRIYMRRILNHIQHVIQRLRAVESAK
jgi:hypothetical protein